MQPFSYQTTDSFSHQGLCSADTLTLSPASPCPRASLFLSVHLSTPALALASLPVQLPHFLPEAGSSVGGEWNRVGEACLLCTFLGPCSSPWQATLISLSPCTYSLPRRSESDTELAQTGILSLSLSFLGFNLFAFVYFLFCFLST